MDDDVTLWISQLKSGDEQAAQQIWDQFFARVQAFAQRKLGAIPQRDGDAEDLALSAMNALYLGAREGRFQKLEDRQDLWRLLAIITARKAALSWRKKKQRREVGESVLLNGRDAQVSMRNVPDHAPDYFDSLSMACQDLLGGLDDRLRNVALLRLQGYANDEIAQQVGRSVKSVERYLKLIRETWSD